MKDLLSLLACVKSTCVAYSFNNANDLQLFVVPLNYYFKTCECILNLEVCHNMSVANGVITRMFDDFMHN